MRISFTPRRLLGPRHHSKHVAKSHGFSQSIVYPLRPAAVTGLFAVAMPTAYPLPTNLSPTTVNNTASLIRIVALALISGAAIASRLFAVINFESIIHEL